MRNFLLTAALLTGLALAQGPFTTFDCAVYGSTLQQEKETKVDVWTKNQDDKPQAAEGLVLQGSSRILPAVDPSRLSPTGPSHRLIHSDELELKPGSYGDLDLSNSARLVLAPGEYRVENLTLHNSADVDLDGPVVLYIGKSLSVLNSADLNKRGRPGDLQVYQAEPNRAINVVVANSAEAHMAVCGPTANVRIANQGTVYGSVIARQVSMANQAAVHYDPALKSVKLRR